MFPFDYINPKIFFIALVVGLFLTYATTPMPDILYKFPVPDTSDKLVYKDTADNCFHLSMKPMKCTGDEKNIPIQ